MIKKASYLSIHSRELSRRYAGRCIAVVDDKVVAVGKNRLKVYKKAVKDIPRNKKVGVYYLPTKDELLTAL
jgi:ABC-type phosphate/phosphonate transport system ATPase subunit